MSAAPTITVVVPTHTVGDTLPLCLDALLKSDYEDKEIIVVCDGTTDECGGRGREGGVTFLHLPVRSGPAAARNEGASKARGDVLLFIDSDVLVRKDTISRVAAVMREQPTIDAVFGSYDDEPARLNFLSQYKNLHHHFIHQTSRPAAETFWAGCGAIRRRAFAMVGGFDQTLYKQPSIEDIELGYRLREKGCRINLDRTIQVKHLKCWNVSSLLRTEIFARALPWSRLIVGRHAGTADLNLRWHHRISALLVGLILISALASLAFPEALWGLSLLLPLVVLNVDWYYFLLKKKGLRFTLAALPVHWFYYLYSSLCFALCWSLITLRKPSATRPR